MKTKAAFIIFFMGMSLMAFSQEGQFVELTGKVLDADTKKEMPRCNVYLKGEDIGTVTNNTGQFLLKVPSAYIDKVLVISTMGYESYEIEVRQFQSLENTTIRLKSVPVMLDEVVIGDVDGILLAAMKRRAENYPDEYKVMTSFYREIVKKNRKYVDVSQGIINISKSPYESAGRDKMSIVKGGRSENYSKGDTLAFRLMGGPNTMLLLDVVKNPGLLLDRDIMENYVYSLHGIKTRENKRNYEIHFEPKAIYNIPLYAGVIYIDERSFAITALEFSLDEDNMKIAAESMVKKSPNFVTVTPLSTNYEVKYRESNGKWYLDYVRAEIEVKCKWKRRLFNSTFNSVSEMVVTSKDVEDPEEFNRKNTTKLTDIFAKEVVGYMDESFWENYSIIQPEDDLRKALAKIQSKQ